MKGKQLFIAQLLALLCLWATLQKAWATHMQGAEIAYACLGGNVYSVSVTLYSDCRNHANVGTSVCLHRRSVQCNVNVSSNINLAARYQLPTFCSTPPLSNPNYPNSVLPCPNTNNPQILVSVYTGTMTLPSNCVGSDWVLQTAYSRNTHFNNFSGTTTAVVRAQLNRQIAPCNSSPKFVDWANLQTCVGQTSAQSFAVIEPDGDSVVVEMVSGLHASSYTSTCVVVSSVPLVYNAGRSGAQPIYGTSNFDASTGLWTYTPSQGQYSLVCVQAREYRNGVLVGSIWREFALSVGNCVNQAPSIMLPSQSLRCTVGRCTVAVSPVCWSFMVEDMDTVLPRPLQFSLEYAPAGATMQVQQVSTRDWRVEVCWQPTVADTGRHWMQVRVREDLCPTVKEAIAGAMLEVVRIQEPPLVVQVLQSADTLCRGDTLYLEALLPNASATGWHWSGRGLGDTTSAATWALVDTTGEYEVRAYYGNGCSSLQSVSVLVHPPARLELWSMHGGAACRGDDIFLLADYDLGEGAYLDWYDAASGGLLASSVGSALLSPQIFNAPSVGDTAYFALRMRDTLSGCVQWATTAIPIAPALSAQIRAHGNVSVFGGSDGWAVVHASGGTAPYTYFWLPSHASTDSAFNLSAGTHIVQVQDANGCHTADTFALWQPNFLLTQQFTPHASLSPNPATYAVWIEVEKPAAIDITIIDNTGNIVLSRHSAYISTQHYLDLSALAAGTYTVRIAFSRQNVSYLRLVKL